MRSAAGGPECCLAAVNVVAARTVQAKAEREHRSERTPRCVSEERSRQRTHGPSRRPPWYRATSTPCGREVGEIPTQSRYGERSHESASPVADHTVHARTFERKVGRTRATDRLDPSFDACRSEGFAIRRDPSESIPLRRFPCSRRSHRPREPRRPAGCQPSIAVLVLILAACSGTAAPSTSPSAALASATPVATAAPTPSPSAGPGLPGVADRRRGHGRHDPGGAPEDRLADAGHDRDPVRTRRRRPRRRDR